jgi:hypothetical protein
MTKEQQELVDYLRSHVWAGGKPSDEKLKAANLIEQQAKELDHLKLDNDQYRIANTSLGERVEKQAKEIEELKQTQSHWSIRKKPELQSENEALKQENKELREALEWALGFVPQCDTDNPNTPMYDRYAKAKALSRAKVEVGG